jgi:hypothetical protein
MASSSSTEAAPTANWAGAPVNAPAIARRNLFLCQSGSDSITEDVQWRCILRSILVSGYTGVLIDRRTIVHSSSQVVDWDPGTRRDRGQTSSELKGTELVLVVPKVRAINGKKHDIQESNLR